MLVLPSKTDQYLRDRLKKAPPRIGFRWAAVGFGVFVLLAIVPYARVGAIRLASGRTVDMATITAEVKAMDKKAEKDAHHNKPFEARCVVAVDHERLLIGGKQGLGVFGKGGFELDGSYPGLDVRSIERLPEGDLLIAAKDGVWRRRGTEWSLLLAGDFHDVAADAFWGLLAVSNKTGVHQSVDGTEWQLVPGAPAPMNEETKPEMKPETPQP